MLRFGIIFAVVFVVGIIFYCVSSKMEKEHQQKLRDLQREVGCHCLHYVGGGDGELNLDKQDPRLREFFSIVPYTPSLSYKTPEEYVFTGATVGGVTTGGIHKVGGETKYQTVSSGRFVLRYKHCAWYDEQIEIHDIKTIKLTEDLVKAAKKHRISSYLNGRVIQVVDEVNVSAQTQLLLNSVLRTGNTDAVTNSYIKDGLDSYPTREKCEAILDFICGGK